ncbi:succinate dehydrogenase hydrophobic anchor subunit [Haloferula luteola]|uniref:Succinate dehydrogenase hydrophobic anchor subunit n=1 Tax=Haloferula luteola TaxID=595692 RepID=A0A840V6C9_9BACT|nr:hypothetical protein [Haloferula luteola]MBB5353203.1 succinate dehydrogenase hydrophobic anchor subunit [Haloferula luteola]
MLDRDPDKDKPDWDSFECWNGDERKERWTDRWIHGVMVVVALALVFFVTGVLGMLMGQRHLSIEQVMNDTSWTFWSRFVISGLAGVIATIWIYFRKIGSF